VLEVGEGHKKQDACELIQTLPEPVREPIQAVAVDMSAGFLAAVVEVLP
jgi:transposase